MMMGVAIARLTQNGRAEYGDRMKTANGIVF